MRFDYIFRKAMKICGNDSTENFNEQTVEQVWFLTLDSILKLKQGQLKLLESLRPKNNNVFDPSYHPETSAPEPPSKYDAYIENLEEFFKSRIDYVIENILKYIELDDFLNHIVLNNDTAIKYQELSVLI